MQIFLVNKSGGRIEVCAQSMIILGILKLGRRKNIRNVLTSAKKSCDVRLFSLAKLRKKCVMGKSFIAIAFYFYHFGIFVSIPLSHTDAFFGGDPPILEETPPPSRLACRPPIGWLSNLLWIIIFNNSAHFFFTNQEAHQTLSMWVWHSFFLRRGIRSHTWEIASNARRFIFFFSWETPKKSTNTHSHLRPHRHYNSNLVRNLEAFVPPVFYLKILLCRVRWGNLEQSLFLKLWNFLTVSDGKKKKKRRNTLDCEVSYFSVVLSFSLNIQNGEKISKSFQNSPYYPTCICCSPNARHSSTARRQGAKWRVRTVHGSWGDGAEEEKYTQNCWWKKWGLSLTQCSWIVYRNCITHGTYSKWLAIWLLSMLHWSIPLVITNSAL